jgi:DNA-directed RNA polymerase subunit H (RpoH/RPB5)
MALWHTDQSKRSRVCTTLCEMLEDRGFTLVVDDALLTGDERTHLREMPIVATNDDGDLLAVDYCLEPKMSVKALRKLVATVNACCRLACIISVVHHSVTPYAVKEQQQEERLQIFKYHELMFNVTQHVLVPLHVRVPAADVPALLQRLGAKIDQIPAIFSNDPVVRYHGWPPSTMVCVERRMLSTHQMYYRLVVAHP